MNTIRITTAQNIDIDYELAGLGERIVASLIDYGIFLFIYLASIILGVSLKLEDITTGIVVIIYFALYVFYDLICEIAMNGQSVGKKVMKIRVMSADGNRPRISQYLLRWIFRIIDFGISGGTVALVVAAISERTQRIGDLVAGTVLIRTVPRTDVSKVAFHPADSDYQPVFAEALQLTDQDVELINEVINAYVKTGNSVLVYNMAAKLKEHLKVTLPANMNDMQFLQTLLKDYTHQVSQTESF
ncbi:RDD family protein [Mucilaginibacter litoreus]|uniref:RDD family protein n=1 Tax=Mucilaginibacter litoreus TaxID=1048221 RepID=A0ABW3AU26_9SPHI